MRLLIIVTMLFALTACEEEPQTGSVVAGRYFVTTDGKQTLCAPNCSTMEKGL